LIFQFSLHSAAPGTILKKRRPSRNGSGYNRESAPRAMLEIHAACPALGACRRPGGKFSLRADRLQPDLGFDRHFGALRLRFSERLRRHRSRPAERLPDKVFDVLCRPPAGALVGLSHLGGLGVDAQRLLESRAHLRPAPAGKGDRLRGRRRLPADGGPPRPRLGVVPLLGAGSARARPGPRGGDPQLLPEEKQIGHSAGRSPGQRQSRISCISAITISGVIDRMHFCSPRGHSRRKHGERGCVA